MAFTVSLTATGHIHGATQFKNPSPLSPPLCKLSSSANVVDMRLLSRCGRQKYGSDHRNFQVNALFGGKKDNNDKSGDKLGHYYFSRRKPSPLSSLRFSTIPSRRFVKLVPFAFDGDTEAPQVQEPPEVEVLDSSDGAVGVEDSTGDDEVSDAGETPASPLLVLLQSYKEALANNDEDKVAQLESSLKSIEDEKVGLEGKVASLSAELSIERDRVIRISADFDNFRKRTERDRLSLVTNAQGEVVESFLSVLDNFERAKAQIKVETEAEEKINNSYQSIYKQFNEILTSLGVESVETVGKPFDPLGRKPVGSKFNRVLDEFFQLHEAIMREDSDEFEEGIILQEFRKGFKLGDRLLRPSMVKVSAGPGPAKPEQEEEQVTSEVSQDSKENDGSTETESA